MYFFFLLQNMPLRKKSTRTKFDQKKRYIQNKTNKRKHPQDELPVPKKEKPPLHLDLSMTII